MRKPLTRYADSNGILYVRVDRGHSKDPREIRRLMEQLECTYVSFGDQGPGNTNFYVCPGCAEVVQTSYVRDVGKPCSQCAPFYK